MTLTPDPRAAVNTVSDKARGVPSAVPAARPGRGERQLLLPDSAGNRGGRRSFREDTFEKIKKTP